VGVSDRGVERTDSLIIDEGGQETQTGEAKEERVAAVIRRLSLKEAIVEVQRGLLLEVIDAALALDRGQVVTAGKLQGVSLFLEWVLEIVLLELVAAIEFEHAAIIRAVGPLLALAAHVDGPHDVVAGVEAAVSSQL
jgi:hypothetical protein